MEGEVEIDVGSEKVVALHTKFLWNLQLAKMSRNAYRGPKLPRVLLDQVQDGNKFKNKAANVSRKDRRKAERQQKKAVRSKPGFSFRGDHRRSGDVLEDDDDLDEEEVKVPAPKSVPTRPVIEVKPLKSILKKPPLPPESEPDSEGLSDPAPPTVSRGVKGKLDEDDAEIAALEQKLGIKRKKSKALESDGLDWIVDGSEGESDDDVGIGSKRKRPEDTKWLKDKRLKASASDEPIESDEYEEDALSTSGSDIDRNYDSEAEAHDLESAFFEEEGSDDFETFNSEDDLDTDEDEAPLAPKRQRENPYIAPVTKDAAPSAKYIPPSLRKPAASDEEALRQLRRQVQGLLNRLSEANMLSILQSLEELYMNNARQHVTSILVGLLVGLISDSSTLNDTFLILHAGFAAAVYKIVGTDFGAHLLEKMVEAFDHHCNSNATEGKQTLNLLAYLSCLYTFQVVGSSLIFDYIRHLLEELSETNTELLLRIIRTSGQQLRQDDPSSLKDIVLLLQRSVANIGEDKLSVRTKFMIETINDLKNNRMKGAAASNVATEHATRMKKMLGSLNSSRSVKAKEPLRITLSDIRDSDKKGKWWLVRASYLDPAKHTLNGDAGKIQSAKDAEEDAGYESETPGSVNLHKLARTQGMNTDVRRAIFVTILSSSDHEEAHMRLLKLHLKAKQMLEIPRVIVHCAGAERAFNPLYAVLARHFCGEHKLRKAFQFTLWDAFRAMNGEEEDEGNEKMSMRKLVNLAKLYGNLVASGGLDIRILKKLDLTSLQDQTSMFVEVLLTTVFVQLRKDGAKDFKKAAKDVFARTAGVPGLPQGLLLFLESTLEKTELASGKNGKRAVEEGCAFATEVLTEATKTAHVVEDDEDDEDS